MNAETIVLHHTVWISSNDPDNIVNLLVFFLFVCLFVCF